MRPFTTTCLRIAVFAMTAFVFVALFGYATSPFYPGDDGFDSIFFRLVALGWSQGMVPYADVVENKGPYLLIVQRIGHALSWDWGLFALQIVNLTAVMELMWQTGVALCRRLGARRPVAVGIAALAVALFMLWRTFNDGNYSEDWSLLFIALPLWLFARSLTPGAASLRPGAVTPLLTGACVGVLALIRINNAALPLAVVIAAAAVMGREHRWGSLAAAAGWFILGLAVTTVPVIAWFACHDAADDLWFCTYAFNFIYNIRWGDPSAADRWSRLVANILWLLPMIAFAAVALWQRRRAGLPLTVFAVAAAVVCLIAFGESTGYPHYFMITVPGVFMFVATALAVTPRKGWAVAIVVMSLLPQARAARADIKLHGLTRPEFVDLYDREVYPVEAMVRENVPAASFASIYPYGLRGELALFLRLKVCPPGKVLGLQSEAARVTPRMSRLIEAYHSDGRPDYILAPDTVEMVARCDSTFLDMLRDYQPADTARGLVLYRRRR